MEREGLHSRADSYEIRAFEHSGVEKGCGSTAAGRKCFAVLSRWTDDYVYISGRSVYMYMYICVIAMRSRMLAVMFCQWSACSVLLDFHRDSGAGNQRTKPSAPYFLSVFYFQMFTEYFAGRVVMF